MVCPPPPKSPSTAPTLPGLSAAETRLVARMPLFAALPPPALTALLEGATVRQVAKGATLFLQDDPADAFFVVLEGWVLLHRIGEDGQEIVIAVFGPGESFAEAAIFGSRNYPVGAQAVEDVRLLAVPAARFVARLRETPDLALGIMAAMSRHLRYMVQQVEQLHSRSSAERLAAFICRLSRAESGADVVCLPLDKGLIAGRLGMRAETLSRGFAKLKREGMATVHGAEVHVHDMARLRAFGGTDD